MSYGYYEYSELSAQQVLQKVSQKEIFEWILGEEVIDGNFYKSPLRIDTDPGCRIDTLSNGDMLFVDFGDSLTHRSCFKLAMDYHKTNLTSIITMICDAFGLSTNVNDYQPILAPFSFESNTDVKKTDIYYQKRSFMAQDRRFWNPYSITELQLVSDAVFPTSTVTIHNYKRNRKSTFRPRSVCYAIHVDDAIKLYQPYNVDYKFITNCIPDNIGNINNITSGSRLIIAKAYKDHRILRNFDRPDTIWFPSEKVIPSYAILYDLCSRFTEIVVFFDNDTTGMETAIKLVAMLDTIAWGKARMAYIPTQCKHKDLGEFKYKEGNKDTITLLQQLNL